MLKIQELERDLQGINEAFEYFYWKKSFKNTRPEYLNETRKALTIKEIIAKSYYTKIKTVCSFREIIKEVKA